MLRSRLHRIERLVGFGGWVIFPAVGMADRHADAIIHMQFDKACNMKAAAVSRSVSVIAPSGHAYMAGKVASAVAAMIEIALT